MECNGDLDEAKVIFLRRLQGGTGKYKGKLPPKYFSCGRIGHYASTCTYREDYKRPDDEEKKNKFKRCNFNRREKKALCSIGEEGLMF